MDYRKLLNEIISSMHASFYRSVIVAVSYNMTARKSALRSSSAIVEAIYEHLDQLGEYYEVTDMRAGNIFYTLAKMTWLCVNHIIHITVKMIAQNYSPGASDSIKPGTAKTALSASAIATIILSTLALTGLLGIFVIVMVKLSSGLTQKSNEKQPLLKDQYGKYYSAT